MATFSARNRDAAAYPEQWLDGTGALLVADDSGNTVWRVASAEGKVTPNRSGQIRFR